MKLEDYQWQQIRALYPNAERYLFSIRLRDSEDTEFCHCNGDRVLDKIRSKRLFFCSSVWTRDDLQRKQILQLYKHIDLLEQVGTDIIINL